MNSPLPIRAASCALDFGVSYDHSALALLIRLAGIKQLNAGHDGRPVYVAVTHIWEQGVPLATVVEEAVAIILRWRPRIIALEPLGVGAMPSQEVRAQVIRARRGAEHRDRTQWLTVNTTRPLKLGAYGALLWGLERQQIVLLRDPEVLKQLAGLRVEHSSYGAKIEAEDPAVHDDVSDALAFSMLPRPTKRGVACHFAQLAQEKNVGPTLAVPNYGAEVIETGGGLRLYAQPALQCAQTGAVAVPAHAAAGGLQLLPDSPEVRAARRLIRQQEATHGE